MEYVGTIGIPLALAMIAIALLLTIAFPLFKMLTDVETAKKSLMAIGSMAVVFLIAYVTSSSELTPFAEKAGITPSLFKWIGAGLNTFIFLFIISTGLVIFDLLKGLIKG